MTTRSRRGAGAGAVAARIVSAIFGIIAAIIVIGILLVVLGANKDNSIVSAVMDVAKFFVGPFKELFKLDNFKVQVAINWGIAAIIYLAVGALISRLLARIG